MSRFQKCPVCKATRRVHSVKQVKGRVIRYVSCKSCGCGWKIVGKAPKS